MCTPSLSASLPHLSPQQEPQLALHSLPLTASPHTALTLPHTFLLHCIQLLTVILLHSRPFLPSLTVMTDASICLDSQAPSPDPSFSVPSPFPPSTSDPHPGVHGPPVAYQNHLLFEVVVRACEQVTAPLCCSDRLPGGRARPPLRWNPPTPHPQLRITAVDGPCPHWPMLSHSIPLALWGDH